MKKRFNLIGTGILTLGALIGSGCDPNYQIHPLRIKAEQGLEERLEERAPLLVTFEGLQLGNGFLGDNFSGHRGRNFFGQIACEKNFAFVSINPSVEDYKNCLDEIKKAYAIGSPIILTGFSDGCRYAIQTSRDLEKLNIPVKKMVLVSPTCTNGFDSELTIPKNVKSVYGCGMDKSWRLSEGEPFEDRDFSSPETERIYKTYNSHDHWNWNENKELKREIEDYITRLDE